MIIVDSNIWIFAEIQNAPEHMLAVEKLQQFLPNGVAINAIIFSEVFHRLSRIFGSVTARERVKKIIHHPSIEWLVFEKETGENAMELSERFGIRINDALIAQQALESKASILTDNVKDFKKVGGLKVIALK